MISISKVKKEAKAAYFFDMRRNIGVGIISFIIKFAVFFAIATVHFLCVGRYGSDMIYSWPAIIFYAAYYLAYIFISSTINLGRNSYYLNVANKFQPKTDRLFRFFGNMKKAVLPAISKSFLVVFYTALFTAITIIYFKIYGLFGLSYFSPVNIAICILIILLFIITLTNALFSYSATAVVIEKNDSENVSIVTARSARVLRGKKGKLFALYLSFTGWYVLGILTLGIGFFWILPYIRISVQTYLSYISK